MSKASRENKAWLKKLNQRHGDFLRKEMTLKAYRKERRIFRRYADGMKKHIACCKGRVYEIF